MARTLYRYPVNNSSSFLTAAGSLALEVFASYSFVTGTGASIAVIDNIGSTTGWVAGDSIRVGESAEVTILTVDSATQITVDAAISWDALDTIIKTKDVGTADYVTIWDAATRVTATDAITQTGQAYTSNSDNEWRFYADGRKTAIRVSDSDNTTLTLERDVVLNPDREESVTQAITAVGDTFVVTHPIVRASADAAYTMTSAPTISTGYNDQIITIINVGTNDIVIQDQGTLGSSNLRLAAAGVTLSSRDSITIQYDATVTDWVQTGNQTVI